MASSQKVAQAQALSPAERPLAQTPEGLFGRGASPFSSMFAPSFGPQAAAEVPDNAPEGSYTYQLVKSGPELPESELETAAASVEIMILWGASVLHVAHLTPPRSFHVGEAAGKDACDVCLPAERIGASRLPVLLAGAGGAVSLVLPVHAAGTVTIAGETLSIERAIESGKTDPCPELGGARQIELPAGSKATLDLGGIEIRIAMGRAVRAGHGRAPIDTSSLSYQGLSTALHLGLLAAAALLVPPLAMDESSSITPEQQYFIQQALAGTAEPQTEPQKVETTKDADGRDSARSNGSQPSGGSDGSAGSMMSRRSGGRVAVEGPQDNLTPQLARQAALADASRFGLIGLLNTGIGGDPNAPTSPWGGDVSLGNDPRSALGNIWGSTLEDAAGSNGLALSGTGEGSDRRGNMIGVGPLGTIDGGLGGPNIGSRRLPTKDRDGRGPITRALPPSVDGTLPADIIQRVVRQNFGRYRFCYQEGLRANPALTGRVSVRFVIGRDGAVSSVGNGGSDLPDQGVIQCVVRSFYGLSFPPPENGIVKVRYPIVFSPG